MSEFAQILKRLPYSPPFLFVDGISAINEAGVNGFYTFKEDEFFYAGHFKGQPITPGVILTECMAQVGLVCLGIYLHSGKPKNIEDQKFKFAFSESQVLFEKPVYPKEKVVVKSQKLYWRMGKLKCDVEMWNSQNQKVAQGTLSGMIINEK